MPLVAKDVGYLDLAVRGVLEHLNPIFEVWAVLQVQETEVEGVL